MESVPIIFDHIERYLGPVNASWMETLDGEKCPFQVVRCSHRVVDTTFFCTLGLGNHPFRDVPGPKSEPLRHELLMAVPNYFGTRNIPPLLQQLGTIALSRNKPFLKGEVIRGTNPVFTEWPFRGFYASHPCVIEDDAFAECVREDGQTVTFVWMAPVYQREIDFVKKYGSSRLEDMFIERSVDLVDLNRNSAVD
jgi:hypothetical protein